MKVKYFCKVKLKVNKMRKSFVIYVMEKSFLYCDEIL